MTRHLLIGRNPVRWDEGPATGQPVMLEGEAFYRISHLESLRPFFLSVVSSSDLWMFVSSTGALTAGRGNPDVALFPYYTDDKIHDSAEITGSKTLLWVGAGARVRLWEPFSERQRGVYRIERRLYKNTWGNQLVWEEHNADLQLTFRYGWYMSDQFGFVRKATLLRTGRGGVRVQVLDGLQNLMPCGVGSRFQLEKSTLLDAYKRQELLQPSGLALFRLSSIPIDRPEPAESLRANVAWALVPGRWRRLLSSVQLDRFRQGHGVKEEMDVRGERGAYFVESTLGLPEAGKATWLMAADVELGAPEVIELAESLRRPERLRARVEADIKRGTEELRRIVASADGLQRTAVSMADVRHSNNVLFNVMRGGVFADAYAVDPEDLLDFVRTADRDLAVRWGKFIRRLRPGTPYARVVELAAGTGDAQLERLCREYLPLTFSRRHGDPSRPWNRFSIVTRRPDGKRVLGYEGNWRDIFQNWEALAASYPAYLPGLVSRFVSASTVDGYNPYRLTREGVDWEVPDPADPWAHIGYWGDHQLIYLLKLLEMLRDRQPGTLRAFLTREVFASANVPYRIKPYTHLVAHPKETVDFDFEAEKLVVRRVGLRGSDGRLVWDANDQVRLVNLTEKLVVAVLAKLANFIPEAGIWLNTQRPEWNDANNALVGNGVSVVTLAYLRRYVAFCAEMFEALPSTRLELSVEVERWLSATAATLRRHQPLLEGRIRDADRRRVVDELGEAGSRYRQRVYSRGFSGRKRRVANKGLADFFALACQWADHSLRANRREDSLYHAYNLVRFEATGSLSLRRLYEMLEGQVAALSSGALSAEESLALLDALAGSAMYRPDQHSYLLYPNRELPRFLERNNIPAPEVRRSRLLRRLLAARDRSLIEQDRRGVCHFAGALTNAKDVERVLTRLEKAGHAHWVRRERAEIMALFERLFDHESFTGRSGTFFAYEGLGSIYWHMVSKLLLAVQETLLRGWESGAEADVLVSLRRHYAAIRQGIGDCKTPAEYGAFPADPYSHTPAHTGARQPGLTGQVKEDILCRLGELGVMVRDGRLGFRPRLIQEREFLSEPGDFPYVDVAGKNGRLRLAAGSLAFTCCQVPVVYRRSERDRIVLFRAGGSRVACDGPWLDAATSASVFARDGQVRRVEVEFEGDGVR